MARLSWGALYTNIFHERREHKARLIIVQVETGHNPRGNTSLASHATAIQNLTADVMASPWLSGVPSL